MKEKEIRAVFDGRTIRVYQAYNDIIAKSAVEAQRFVSPPFSMTSFTWIKPSFLWMMYRAGRGHKDPGQSRVLAIDITHEGFEWALRHSCGTHRPTHMSREDWTTEKQRHPVRVQWDPERDLHFLPLAHRSIQIGLSDEAVAHYVDDWIVAITDITDHAHAVADKVRAGDLEAAAALCPKERPYDRLLPHDQFGD